MATLPKTLVMPSLDDHDADNSFICIITLYGFQISWTSRVINLTCSQKSRDAFKQMLPLC